MASLVLMAATGLTAARDQAPVAPAAFILFDDGFELGDIELPFGSTNQTLSVLFGPVDPRADLVFSMDTTGSMGGEIANIRNGFVNIIASTRAIVPDTAYAVGEWKDFPVAPFGEPGNRPWLLRQSVTTNAAAASAGLNVLSAAGGGDIPESGYEALYQIGAGSGVMYPGGPVPPYTGAGLGGVGFRAGSSRLVMHVTDAPSHLDTDYTTIPDAHSRSEALASLAALGVRVIPVLSPSADTAANTVANNQALDLASSTGAEVLPCAFEPVPGCAVNQCCTGVNGVGEAPAANGRCPLRFRVTADGIGASAAVSIGMHAAVKYGTHQLVASASDDGSMGTLDTTCFVERIEAAAFIRPAQEPEASCVPEATPVSIGGGGFNDGFANLATGSVGGTVGSVLRFVVRLRNLCAPATASPQVFVVNLSLTDTVTGAVMDQRTLSIAVPASP